MAFRFIHTADWQIGKIFSRIPSDYADNGPLRQARLDVVTRIGELASEHNVYHVLVAGDVWDNASPSVNSRNRVLERMREHSGIQWHLLPGNHDYYQPNGIWDHIVRQGLPPNVRAHVKPEIAEIEPYVAALLPAPLPRKNSSSDLTEWMDGADTDPGLIRIGLAHGSARGFGSNPTARTNPIDPERPSKAHLDYLALGDWHGPLEVNDRCRYSGTPETDSFNTEGTGTVLLVEIDGPGQTPQVNVLPTGQYRWHSLEESLYSTDAIDTLDAKLRDLDGENSRKLVDLKVRGALSLADTQYFRERIGEQTRGAFYCLHIDSVELQRPPTDEVLKEFDPPGVIGMAVRRLVETIELGGDDTDLAHDALYRLYVEYKRHESGTT